MKKLSFVITLSAILSTSICAYASSSVKAASEGTSITQQYKMKKHLLTLKRKRKKVVYNH